MQISTTSPSLSAPVPAPPNLPLRRAAIPLNIPVDIGQRAFGGCLSGYESSNLHRQIVPRIQSI